MRFSASMKKAKQRAISVALCMLLILLCGCSKQQIQALPTESVTTHAAVEKEVTVPDHAVAYQEEYYIPRQNLSTMLIMGLDTYEREEQELAYTNTMQADFLMLLVVDEREGKCSMLHLNRDTMAKIRRLGIGGAGAGSFEGQLALAHTYGSGGSDSCLNAVKAVSGFLDGVTIDHYLTVTMDAVAAINDGIGGVTVTVLDDLTMYDSALIKGETVTLKGEQALTYVRSRKGLSDSTNLNRMERQKQYLEAFCTQLLKIYQQMPDFLTGMMLEMPDCIMSDLTVNGLDAFGAKVSVCEIVTAASIEGESVLGNAFMEFHADEASRKQTVLDLFYEPWNG